MFTTFFHGRPKIFQGDLCPHGYGPVQWNQKRAVCYCNQLQKKSFFIYSAGAENKYESSYLEERFLKRHLSSVECSFIEPNIKDIHADPYLPLATSSSTKRGLACKSLLLTFTGYIHWLFIFFRCMKTYLVIVLFNFQDWFYNNISFNSHSNI